MFWIFKRLKKSKFKVGNVVELKNSKPPRRGVIISVKVSRGKETEYTGMGFNGNLFTCEEQYLESVAPNVNYYLMKIDPQL